MKYDNSGRTKFKIKNSMDCQRMHRHLLIDNPSSLIKILLSIFIIHHTSVSFQLTTSNDLSQVFTTQICTPRSTNVYVSFHVYKYFNERNLQRIVSSFNGNIETKNIAFYFSRIHKKHTSTIFFSLSAYRKKSTCFRAC